jgi:FkbM family methyltransferase
VAFEPDPKNAAFLRRHVAANRAAKKIVAVEEAAVGASNGSVRFSTGTGTGTGHIVADGGIEVRVLKLDDYVAAAGLKPTHLKIDVEGAELDVLKGARETLMRCRPVIFLSTHGHAVHNACCWLLAELDYKLEPIRGNDIQTSSELLCRP